MPTPPRYLFSHAHPHRASEAENERAIVTERRRGRLVAPFCSLGVLQKWSSVAGNGATFYFLVFAILAGVVGAASKLAGANHIRSWRNDSLAAAAASSVVAWAITALAFGVACKEIAVGGYRGWRLRVLEAFIIILAFTQLLYVLLLHAGMFSSKYGPGYRDPDYGVGGGPGEVKGTRI
ncbi:hypothetical protein BHE74_00052737 [Ensete ventricosum]|nr:hypothetical protein BHE74_00052737 [Ensete ventricosum]RZS16990.1 hypothetical protein BHM03_00049077 [Ensete ventricosum]